MNYVLLTFD